MNDCSFAVGSLLPTLSEHLFADLDVERVTAKLQQNRNAKTNDAGEPMDDRQRSEQKLALWEELKILGNYSMPVQHTPVPPEFHATH